MKNLRNLFLIFAVSLPLALTAQLSQFYDEGLKGYHFGETDEIPIAAFFQTYQEDLGLTDLDEMIVFQEETDELAQKHIKYSQRYNGLDVENTIFALHTQNESENLALAHGCI